MKNNIEIGKIFSDRSNGLRVRICDILPAVGAKYNFIYYTETDIKPYVPSYRMSLPEHTFVKRYEEEGKRE